jgi:hypothetical protein
VSKVSLTEREMQLAFQLLGLLDPERWTSPDPKHQAEVRALIYKVKAAYLDEKKKS